MHRYCEHVGAKAGIYEDALAACGYEHVIIGAGERLYPFRDDLDYPFHCNPYFSEWLPVQDRPASYLLVAPGKKPELLVSASAGFWDSPPAAIHDQVVQEFEITIYKDVSSLEGQLNCLDRAAWLGPPDALSTKLPVVDVNPTRLIDHIDYYRAYKTHYEIACINEATRLAKYGHAAAAAAFAEGRSELEIHLAYLAAASASDDDLPYRSIIALNENAATLHHMARQTRVPASHRSLLIDAGMRSNGYASDISRTHVAADHVDSMFAALVHSLDKGQQELVASIQPGRRYTDLHEVAHRLVATLLVEHRLILCGVDEALDSGLTRVFLPHGLGHLLGIQVHDQGGHLRAPDGTQEAPPSRDAALRLTRPMEPDMVFTVEPGIYFIESLLSAFPNQSLLNLDAIDQLRGFGGIRIEDNVLVTSGGASNLTRSAFESADV